MVQPSPRQRRQWIAWYFAHGENVSATCVQFGIHRSTLSRWLARHARQPQKPLRARSRRPYTTRQPTWSMHELRLVCGFLGEHPRWGRGRVTVALCTQTGLPWSEATVGRMLARIQTQCPICQGHAGRHDAGIHALSMTLSQAGVPDPAVPGPYSARDPEMAAMFREANALRRRR